MKSSILIVSYLWKDTWSRWLEQPSSLLARMFVGALLVMVATVILVAFQLLERSLRVRLENFGLNTLVVREPVAMNDPELLPNASRPDRLAFLSSAGRKVRLRQLYPRARTEWQQDIVVMSYDPESFPEIARWMSPESPLVLFSETLPSQIQTPVQFQRQSGYAVVMPMDDFWRPLALDHFLLVPRGWAPEAERVGFMEITLFKNESGEYSIGQYSRAVQLMYQSDRETPPQVHSALPLLRELDQLQARQNQWRGLLAGALGLTLALVFGAIAVLEFRQNLFISALLRSLGTPAKFLFFRQWAENAFLANLAAFGAIGLVALFHEPIFGGLGFPSKVLNVGEANPYWSGEMALILVWVNLGAFLSSLPVALGLRRPVGAILN